MQSRSCLLMVVSSVSVAASAWAETAQTATSEGDVGDFLLITMADGSQRQGRLLAKVEERLKLEVRMGDLRAATWIPRAEIKSISIGESPQDLYEERLAKVAEGDASGHYELGQWCLRQTPALRANAVREFRTALAIDPEHPQASRALELQGYVKHEGEWLTKNQSMLAKGFVRERGRWVKPGEVQEARPVGEGDAERAGPTVTGATFEAQTVTAAYNHGEPVLTKHYVKGKMMRVELLDDVSGEYYPYVIYRGDGRIFAVNPEKRQANEISLTGTVLGVGGSDFAKELLGLGQGSDAKAAGGQDLLQAAGGAFGVPGGDLFGLKRRDVDRTLQQRGFRYLGKQKVDGRATQVYLKGLAAGLELPSLAGGVKIWIDAKTRRPVMAESQLLGQRILSKYRNYRAKTSIPASKLEIPRDYEVVKRSLIDVLAGRSGM